MDLTQTKLTKSEWQSIETPVSEDENKILKMIKSDYHNIDIRYNDHLNLLSIIRKLQIIMKIVKRQRVRVRTQTISKMQNRTLSTISND